ncbi:MAG: glycosyltransferase [Alphaproteobacteria bacterium]|nr:glycosyltransferase [Alphaproteobacteria bacterium]
MSDAAADAPRIDIAGLLAEAATLGFKGKPLLALPLRFDPRAVTIAALNAAAGVVFPARDLVPAVMPADRAGWLHHPPYDWTLPATGARWILFLGPRRRIAVPMLRAALRHGLRSVVYAGPRGLKAEPIAAMLARRALEVALHRVARRAPALDRMEGRALEKIVAAMLRRAPAPAAAAPDRILLANHSLSMGGAERQIVNTLRGLKTRGFADLALACERRQDYGTDDPFGRALEQEKIPILELAGLPISDVGLPSSEGLPHSLGDDVVFWAGLLRAHRPAVLHAWQDATAVKAGLAAALVGVPRIVLALRNRAPWRFGYWLPWMRPVIRALARQRNVVLTNNSRAGAADYARWLDLPDDHIRVVWNALAPEALAPAAPREAAAFRARLGIPEGLPIVGSVFRFYPEKDPLLWIAVAQAVAARMRYARFLLIGDGPLKPAMQEAARQAGIADRLVLAGEIDNSAPALAAMQVFLLTSREEGLPNVVIEAQAQGVPVVTTHAGGAPEAIDDGRSGFAVASRDAEFLAQAVLRALEDCDWAMAAAKRARECAAERFGMELMVNRTLRLYGFDA